MGLTLISLAGFSITNLLNSWSQMGVFSYVLPFLLVFALIFAILEKSAILGDNKGVIVIISLAAGLLSLVGGKVPAFFQLIFPNLGIALAILLAVMILLGLFMTWDAGIGKTVKWIIAGSAIVAIVFLVYYSFVGYGGNYDFWGIYGNAIITILIIVAIILIVVFGAKKSKTG